MRHFPTRSISISLRFVDTIFLENSMRAVSITKCGSAVIWSNSIVLETQSDVMMRKSGAEQHKREFIKSIKLCENPLSVIKSFDDYIVIANAMGKISFYDKDLKILFWCPSHDFIDSIITISFDLTPKLNCDEVAQGQAVRDFLIRKGVQIDFFLITFLLRVKCETLLNKILLFFERFYCEFFLLLFIDRNNTFIHCVSHFLTA